MSTTQHSNLATVIASMLVENTGTHMLDSGGAYGRSWQRNQQATKDSNPVDYFEAEPASYWNWPSVYPHPNFREGKDPADFRAELNPTHSVYHWLTEVALADYNEEMDKALAEFGDSDAMKDEHWLGIMDAFPEHWARLCAHKEAEEEADRYELDEDESRESLIEELAEDYYHPPGGIYGEGNILIHNTYNGEDCLSQTLQFAYFEHDHSAYALLQIHGGADVRGGYTAPRAFDLGSHGDGTEIFDNARAGCSCDNEDCDARWYTDDAGANWYTDDGYPELDDLPAREGTWVEAGFLNLKDGVLTEGELPTIVIEERGQYAPTNKVWCPICGRGELTPWLY